MTTAAPARPRRRTSISARLTLILLPLVVIPLVVLGAAAYVRAQQLLRLQAAAQLSSTVAAEAGVLESWIRFREDQATLRAQSAAMRQAAATLVQDPASTEARVAARDELTAALTAGMDTVFSDTMVVRASDNRVLVATDTAIQGRVLESLANGELPRDSAGTNPLVDDPALAPGEFALVTTIPIQSQGGEVEAYFVGVNRGLRLASLMDSLQGLWEERGGYRVEVGETFLAVAPDSIVSYPRYATSPLLQSGVDHPVYALAAESPTGSADYDSLDAVPVLGAYEWATGQDLGLIVEVPQSAVYAGLSGLGPFFAGLLAVTILAVLLLVPLATRASLRPLTVLAQVVERIARGQFEQRVPIERNDEVGRLGESFNTMATELSTMYRSLEERVAERTHQIQTASEVARDASSIRDVDALLDQVVRLISERFDYYHAGIFLVEGDDAVLRAASSEGGRRTLARGHRLAVGKVGLVGYVTGTGKPRVAVDVGADAVHFANPDLPHTRSELALPLRVGERVIGALDVQSTEPNAFDENDVVVLQTMADQLATALENARLLDSLRRQSADRQRVIEVYSRLAQQPSYDVLLQQVAGDICHSLGFRRAMLGLVEGDEIVIRSAADARDPHPPELGMVVPISQGLLGRAVTHGDFVQQHEIELEGDQVTIAAPLRGGGRVFGVLAVTRQGVTEAEPEDFELLRLLLAPLAAALENARLVEESHRSLNEIDSLYRQQAADAWQQILHARQPASAEGTYQPGMGPSGGESELVTPIEVRGEVIGALDIRGRTGGDLDREDEIILEAVAEELASALEQARLMEEIRRRAVQLQAAAEISRETTSQLDSATLLNRAVQLLHDRFGYDQVAVYRLDWQTSSAVVQAAAGLGAEELLADAHQVPVGSATVLGYVIQGGNAYAASDEVEDPYFHVTRYLPTARSELGLPLMIGDQVFGAILIRHSQPNAFGRDDVTVLEVLADQIAVGVQNARLFEATLRRAQREQAVIEITGKIRTSGGIDGILRTAVREMRQAMGARQAQIWLNAPAPTDGDGNGDGGNGGGGA
jgi:GAF domain-containing protein